MYVHIFYVNIFKTTTAVDKTENKKIIHNSNAIRVDRVSFNCPAAKPLIKKITGTHNWYKDNCFYLIVIMLFVLNVKS